jgi:hypothetical protein
VSRRFVTTLVPRPGELRIPADGHGYTSWPAFGTDSTAWATFDNPDGWPKTLSRFVDVAE